MSLLALGGQGTGAPRLPHAATLLRFTRLSRLSSHFSLRRAPAERGAFATPGPGSPHPPDDPPAPRLEVSVRPTPPSRHHTAPIPPTDASARVITGTDLRRWRLRYALTQAEVARRLGYSRQWLCDIEHERARVPVALYGRILDTFTAAQREYHDLLAQRAALDA